MKLPRRKFMHLAAGAAALPVGSRIARAQTYPSRPVTMVVPFAAGSGTDLLARILSPRLSELLGQQVIVENIGGAGGMTGSARVAKASPDGYQFVLGNIGTHAQNQTLYKNPLYNASLDFSPVVRFSALGGLTGALFIIPVTWIEWKSSGPDSGPPEQTLEQFAISWFSDPGIALDLIFPVAGVITAMACWRLCAARLNPGAPGTIQ